MFVIFAPPKLNELPVPFEIVASPIFTLSLNSAEVRPVRALAKAIVNLPFSVPSFSAKVMMFAPLSNVFHLSVLPAVSLFASAP